MRFEPSSFHSAFPPTGTLSLPGFPSNLWSSGPIFCLLLGVSSDCAQPITGHVTEEIWPVIGQAHPGLRWLQAIYINRAGPLRIWDLHLVITVSADAPAPNSAWPSAGTVITANISLPYIRWWPTRLFRYYGPLNSSSPGQNSQTIIVDAFSWMKSFVFW